MKKYIILELFPWLLLKYWVFLIFSLTLFMFPKMLKLKTWYGGWMDYLLLLHPNSPSRFQFCEFSYFLEIFELRAICHIFPPLSPVNTRPCPARTPAEASSPFYDYQHCTALRTVPTMMLSFTYMYVLWLFSAIWAIWHIYEFLKYMLKETESAAVLPI